MLKAVAPVDMDDVIVGQYVSAETNPGYLVFFLNYLVFPLPSVPRVF